MLKNRVEKITIGIISFAMLFAMIRTPIYAAGVDAQGNSGEETMVTTEESSATVTIKGQTSGVVANGYNEEDGMVIVRLVYEDTGEVIHSGSGFFIGTSEHHYVLTSKNIVTLTADEKAALAAAHETEADRIRTTIQVLTTGGVQWSATQESGTDNQSFDLLSLTGSVGNVSNLRLAETYSMEANQPVYTMGVADLNNVIYKEGIINDWTTDSNSKKIFTHNLSLGDSEVGSPILNADGLVLGINVRHADGSIVTLQICEVIAVLETIGITYNDEIRIDTTALAEAMALYEQLNEEKYKDASWLACTEQYTKAQELMKTVESDSVNNSTQTEVNQVAEDLKLSIENLEPVGMTTKQMIIITVIALIVAVGICVTVVMIVTRRNKKYIAELKEQGNKTMAAEEALKLSGRITPGEIQNKTGMPTNRSLAEVQNVAVHETTVLSMMQETNQVLYGGMETQLPPQLIRRRTGEKVFIQKQSFLIGKAKEQVDFWISNNSNVSRTHACIKHMPDGYYIQDLNATNGTFVDGVKVKWDRDVKLMSGSIIKIADEEFEFVMG